MNVSLKKLKNCKKVIEVKLPPEKVKDEFDKAYAGINKVAKVPGFRHGKAPRDLLEINYSGTAKEQVIKKLVPETYRSALEEYKLDPIGYPDISDLKIDMKDGFSYIASIETRPEITLKNYKGLKVKKKKFEIREQDVDRQLESLRAMSAQNIPKKDSEEKEKKIPDLDDEFAKDLGFENLDKLKGAIRGNLQEKAKQEIQADLEAQIINQLSERENPDVPESLVESEKKRLMRDFNNRIAYMQELNKENPDKKIELTDKDKKEMEANSEKQALRQVKAFFILDKIAQVEKIYIQQEDIEKRIEAMAVQYKRPKEEVRKYLQDNHMLDEIAVNMRNAKVMEFLLKEAKVKD